MKINVCCFLSSYQGGSYGSMTCSARAKLVPGQFKCELSIRCCRCSRRESELL